MAVCDYFYFKFVHLYKSNLNQPLTPTALVISETQDEMEMSCFALLELPTLGKPGSRKTPLRKSRIQFPGTRIIPLREYGI